MYEKPINGEHEIVKKNLYLCTTFLNFPKHVADFCIRYPVYFRRSGKDAF